MKDVEFSNNGEEGTDCSTMGNRLARDTGIGLMDIRGWA